MILQEAAELAHGTRKRSRVGVWTPRRAGGAREPGNATEHGAQPRPVGAAGRVAARPPAVARGAGLRAPRARALALGPLRDDTLLLASELVTNAVHRADAGGGPPLRLEAELGAAGVHVEVRDGGRRFEPGPEPDYGLRIVAGAADRWGVESDDGDARLVRARRDSLTLARAPALPVAGRLGAVPAPLHVAPAATAAA